MVADKLLSHGANQASCAKLSANNVVKVVRDRQQIKSACEEILERQRFANYFTARLIQNVKSSQ